MNEKVDEMFAPEPTVGLVDVQKWVRVQLGGVFIADSRRVKLLREKGRLPVYLFPEDDVRKDCLDEQSERSSASPHGRITRWTVRAGDKVAEGAAWMRTQPRGGALDIAGHVAFEWNAMDAWFEEEEEVYTHARDPFKRVDDLQSSRHVEVVVAGETVADSERPVVLFETGLPERLYLPKTDVRMDLLVSSDTVTHCSYKGEANYYSVRVGDELVEDIAWYYRYPTREVPRIDGRICFYDERVDATYVDGEVRTMPATPWSRRA